MSHIFERAPAGDATGLYPPARLASAPKNEPKHIGCPLSFFHPNLPHPLQVPPGVALEGDAGLGVLDAGHLEHPVGDYGGKFLVLLDRSLIAFHSGVLEDEHAKKTVRATRKLTKTVCLFC